MDLVRFLLRTSRSMVLAIMIASVASGVLSGAMIAIVNRSLAANGAGVSSILAAFLAIVLARVVTQFVSAVLLVRFSQDTMIALCRKMCEQILLVPFAKVEAMGSARVLVTLTEDVSVLAGAVLAVPTLATNLAMLAGCAIYLAWLSWKVLAVCLALAAVGALGHRALMGRARAAFVDARDGRDRLFAAFRTLTEGLKELKLHRARRTDFMRREIDETAERLRRDNIKVTTQYMLADTWSQLLFYTLIGMLLFITPVIAKLSTESLTGYVFAALFMMTPVWAVLGTLPTLARGRISLEKIRELGDSLSGADSKGSVGQENVPALKPPLRIELEQVRFAYPVQAGEEHAFGVGPLDLHLSSGELLFITGGNGTGKSTLVKLLCGLYTPESGRIVLNGRPVDDANRDWYREHFAAVFADYHLFERLFGLETAGREQEIAEYLILLRLDRKVRIEDGRFSSIALSSGQRKRLALLTVFLEDRPVYVFDEWAADQDPSYKEVFYHRLLPELKNRGKCVVVVTHDDRYFHMGDRVIKLEAPAAGSDLREHGVRAEAVSS
jgi:putative pyoverdin transport system ATP-binding/permease protein